MGVIAELMVEVGANVNEFKKGMADVHKEVGEAEGGFAKFGKVAAGAGLLALGAVTGVVAFGMAAVEKTTEAGQAAFQMSEKFGIATDQASAWLTVARHLGVDSDALGAGFKFLTKNVETVNLAMQNSTPSARAVSEAGERLSLAQTHYNEALKAHGANSDQARAALIALQGAQDKYNKVSGETEPALKGVAQAFSALGINVFDSQGKLKNANDLMLESADTFEKMPDGIEKSGLAIKLFGKNGMEMLPVLNLGRKGIQDLMDAGKLNGEVMGKDQVEAAHKLYLEQQKLNSEITGLTTQLGTALMPTFQAVIGFIIGTAVPAVQRFANYFRDHLMPAITQVWAFFMEALGPMITYIKGHFDSIKPVLIGVGIVIGVVLAAAVIAIGLVVLAVVGVVAVIVWFAGQVQSSFTQAGQFFSALGGAAHNMVNSIAGRLNDLVGFISGLPGRIGAAARGMWDGLWNAFRGVLNLIVNAWNRLHFTIGGGSFAGQNIPSMTLSVPHLPNFDFGGIVPGPIGSRQIIAALGGEEVRRIGAGGPVNEIHIHMDGIYAGDGPSLDVLANRIAQRMRYATGT